MMRDNDLGATICCWLPRGKMDRQRRHRGSRGMLPSQKYPHSRHKVTLFTLGVWLGVYDPNQPGPTSSLPSAGGSRAREIARRRSAGSRYLRIKMITRNLEIEAKRVLLPAVLS